MAQEEDGDEVRHEHVLEVAQEEDGDEVLRQQLEVVGEQHEDAASVEVGAQQLRSEAVVLVVEVEEVAQLQQVAHPPSLASGEPTLNTCCNMVTMIACPHISTRHNYALCCRMTC